MRSNPIIGSFLIRNIDGPGETDENAELLTGLRYILSLMYIHEVHGDYWCWKLGLDLDLTPEVSVIAPLIFRALSEGRTSRASTTLHAIYLHGDARAHLLGIE